MRPSSLPPLAVVLLALGGSGTAAACPSCSAIVAPIGFGPPVAAASMSPGLKALVDAALDEAAQRAKIDRARLKVVSSEQVTWPDGSLGCPQPGVMYTDALVPGYRIRIQAGGDVLDYHAGRQGPPIFCPKQRAVEPLPGGST